jgi:hypothetical protein
VNYLLPFDVIKRSIQISTVKGHLTITMSHDNFANMIKSLISIVDVDEDWYLEQYPDISQAIKDGVVQSAKQHFIDNGYFEGRIPFPIIPDEEWYKSEYPDVADSIQRGIEPSVQTHFARDGYKEGRLPFKSQVSLPALP